MKMDRCLQNQYLNTRNHTWIRHSFKPPPVGCLEEVSLQYVPSLQGSYSQPPTSLHTTQVAQPRNSSAPQTILRKSLTRLNAVERGQPKLHSLRGSRTQRKSTSQRH